MNTQSTLNFSNRAARFTDLEQETFDILVIGAGITGCGIARDAAMRGLRTALIDASDIGSGTSSRSSKLVHGGLRYLAQGQLGVVKEAANERRILRKLAPHLSLTNSMVVLAPSRKTLALLKTGLWTYEKMGHVDKHERHEVWRSKKLKEMEPAVRSDNLTGAIVYPEYLTDDARLTLANARSAAAHGASVLSYARAEKIIMEGGRASGAVVKGTLASESLGAEIRARIVVNACGPWVDLVRRLENESAGSKLQLTKGIHLVIKKERLPFHRSIVWNAPDGRSLFAVPRGEFVYIGTTDTFYRDPEYWPSITVDDVLYLMKSANSILAEKPLTPSDVVSLWSGLRPLLGAEGKNPSEISRRDEVIEGTGGVLSIAGGKLTSYRSMAQRMVDTCEKRLNRKPGTTAAGDEPLPGGDFQIPIDKLQTKVEELGLTPVEAERVTRLYGIEALEIFKSGKGPAVEAEYAVQAEGALTLKDYWVRRSTRAWFDDDGGLASLEPAADVMATHLGWNDAERIQQIEICRQQRTVDMSVLKSC